MIIKKQEMAEKILKEQNPFSPQLVSKSKDIVRTFNTSEQLYEHAKYKRLT